MIRPLSLHDLWQAPHHQQEVEFKQAFEGFPTLTPVRGVVMVTHQRTFLEVQGEVETIVTLTCHRCLQHYNYRLQTAVSELLWLEPEPVAATKEVEVAPEDLVERLDPHGDFDVEDWLYQQLWLAMPVQQLCREACEGIAVTTTAVVPEPLVDHRWAALQALKEQASKE